MAITLGGTGLPDAGSGRAACRRLGRGQDAAWAPITPNPMGLIAGAATWALCGFGWFLTAIAAAVTGITCCEEERAWPPARLVPGRGRA
jgi:hypothetical protein